MRANRVGSRAATNSGMNTCDTCKFLRISIVGFECSNTKLAPPLREDLTYQPKDDELYCPISVSVAMVNSFIGNVPPHVGPKFGCIHHEPK